MVPQKSVHNIIDAALDLGVNLIDTANNYGFGRTEETLGKAVKGRWDRFVLAGKFYFPTGDGPNDGGASRYHMMNALENSLRLLQTDHLDIYYVHRWDVNTPIEETLRALDDVVRLGKVRYVGASQFAAWQLAYANLLAEVRGWTPFVVAQRRYNMLERYAEQHMLPYCRAHNVGLIPFLPLAGGFLSGAFEHDAAPPALGEHTVGKATKHITAANYDRIENLSVWAKERGRGLNELAHAWLLAQPQVCSVISGATEVGHVLSNAKAADWALTTEELEEVGAILDNAEVFHPYLM